MSLKELTKDNHTKAEETKFMRCVFKKSMPVNVWNDFTYQKALIYTAIEVIAKTHGLLDDLKGIERGDKLVYDYCTMIYKNDLKTSPPRQATLNYVNYILQLDKQSLLAHLYTWHMGDMYGGQMIKKILPGSHVNLEFENAEELKATLRAKLDDSLGDEANRAFEWAIKLMDTYNDELSLEHTD
jgi:heme oxygenase